MKIQKSKATNISPKVKHIVWERDGHKCIFCGSYNAMPNAHVISRAYGGLGIEQNVVTLCPECHHEDDNGKNIKVYQQKIKSYLQSKYKDWKEEELIYKKYDNWG